MDDSSSNGMTVPFIGPAEASSPSANESAQQIWHQALPIGELETVIEHAASTAETLFDVAIAAIHFHPETDSVLRNLSHPPLRSLCANLVAADRFEQVPDTLNDPRYATSPLVCEDPGVRFMACIPLTSERGPTLGALCIADLEPRSLTDADQAKLSDLARATSVQLDQLLDRDADSDRLAPEASPEQKSFMIGSRDPERPVTVARLTWLDEEGLNPEQAHASRRAVVEEVLSLVEVGETVQHLTRGDLLLIIPEDNPGLLRTRLGQFLDGLRTAADVLEIDREFQPTIDARVLTPEERTDQRILLSLETDWRTRSQTPWTLNLQTSQDSNLEMSG